MSNQKLKINSSIILSFYFFLLFILSIFAKDNSFKRYTYITLLLSLFFFIKEILLPYCQEAFRILIRALDFIGFLIQYQLMGIYTTYFRNFCDTYLVEFENKLFGLQPLFVIKSIANPVLTELLMLCYFLYVPILPLIFLYMHWRKIENPDEYVTRLSITYTLTFLLFFIFPIACPRHFIPLQELPVLRGIAIGDLVISGWSKYDIKGGCFPSPHCAAGITIIYFLYKRKLSIAFPITLIMIGMFISTFYGVFHYLTDSITGIILSLIINVILTKIFKL
jgi:hypothetical protein